MGPTHHVCAKEGWHSSFLRRLPKVERIDDIGLVPDTANDRMDRLAVRCFNIFDFGRK